MRGWLRRGWAAFRIAGDRADLWPAGTLAWLAFVGWVPLLLVIAAPDADGIEAVGVSLYLSQLYPFNVVLLAAVLVAGFLILCLLSAAAEVAIEQSANPRVAHAPASRATWSAFAIVLLASLPVVAAAALVVRQVVLVAPAEYLSADLATPVLVRIALRVLPQVGLLLVALLAMQLVAGIALRISFSDPRLSATASLAAAVRRLGHRPLRPLGVATGGLLLDGVAVAVNLALLRLLWGPIGPGLGDGLGTRPATIPLLVGFVAVWLGLLLAAGALHVAVSAWWAMEVGSGASANGAVGGHAATPGRAGPVAGTETGGPQ